MSPLPATLQPVFEQAFSRLLQRTYATAKRRPSGQVDEVDWIEKFHALAGVDIEDDLRTGLRSAGHEFSVAVNSALLHGTPFQAWPRWHHRTARSIEIGDLLVVGEWQDHDSALWERQALLLQMKVGTPSLEGAVRGSKAQAELYATWPRFSWNQKLRSTLPGLFPRAPDPRTSLATQFGVIPPRGDDIWARHDALPVWSGPRFGTPFGLSSALAQAARLDVGVDATLSGSDNGWPRVVQDILESAPRYWFRGQQRFVPVVDPRWPSETAGGSGDAVGIDPGRLGRARDRRFAIVHVGFGPQGAID
jgi:hypothetical protein